MLKRGDKGKEVRELQEKLLGLGYELPKYARTNRRLRLTGADGEVEVPKDGMALYREIMEENGIPPYFAVRRSRR